MEEARALGVPQLMAHLDGRLTLEAAAELAIVQTQADHVDRRAFRPFRNLLHCKVS